MSIFKIELQPFSGYNSQQNYNFELAGTPKEYINFILRPRDAKKGYEVNTTMRPEEAKQIRDALIAIYPLEEQQQSTRVVIAPSGAIEISSFGDIIISSGEETIQIK